MTSELCDNFADAPFVPVDEISLDKDAAERWRIYFKRSPVSAALGFEADVKIVDAYRSQESRRTNFGGLIPPARFGPEHAV